MYIRNINICIKYLFIISMLFLSSCATKGTLLEEVSPSNNLSNYNEAIQLWQDMLALMPSESNFYSEGSLRLGTENNTNRASYILWYNINDSIKFDLNSSFTSLASALIKIQDNTEIIDVYMKPYNLLVKQVSPIGLRDYEISGMVFPITMATLTEIIQGIFPIAFNSKANKDYLYRKIDKIYLDNKTLFYTYYLANLTNSDLIDTWTLDNLGRVVVWNTNNWQINFEYKEDSRQVYKIRANSDNGYIFQMFINLIDTEDMPFNENYFDLILPDNVKIMYNR